MSKTLDDYFCDWEGHNFGFGYGSGEPHIIPAVRTFLETCTTEGNYDYVVLENRLTAPVAWLFLNVLCKADILDYGTSPRYGWLTAKGKRLREYVLSKTADELVNLVCERTCNDTPCYPDACNCGERGYEEGRVCQNPFWLDI